MIPVVLVPQILFAGIFVRIDLPPDERRFSLARETLTALVTSEHGRALGLSDLLLPRLREWAEFFARHLG